MLAQAGDASGETLRHLVAQVAIFVAIIIGCVVLLWYIKGKLLSPGEEALSDDITLQQAREFLRRGLITEDEFGKLRRRILTKSRDRLLGPDKKDERDG